MYIIQVDPFVGLETNIRLWGSQPCSPFPGVWCCCNCCCCCCCLWCCCNLAGSIVFHPPDFETHILDVFTSNELGLLTFLMFVTPRFRDAIIVCFYLTWIGPTLCFSCCSLPDFEAQILYLFLKFIAPLRFYCFSPQNVKRKYVMCLSRTRWLHLRF